MIIGLGISLALLPITIAAGLLAGSMLLIFSLLNPKIGLYLLIPAIPFSSTLQVNLGGISLGPMEALLGLILITWLLTMSTRQEIIIPHPPLLWPFLLFLGAIMLSWLTAFSVKASLVETLKWIEMMALYLFITANFKAKECQQLVIILFLAGSAQAGLGLYQFLLKAGPEGFLLFEGRFLRAFGTFRQPNPYAGYLGLILPLVLSVTLWGGEQLKKREPYRHAKRLFLLSGGVLGVMVAALFASQSRGAWLGFLGAAIITVLMKGGKWAAALLTSLLIMAVLISMGVLTLLPTTIIQRFTDIIPFIGSTGSLSIRTIPLTQANFAILERLAHWQAAQGMWLDNLWLGVGFGNYEVVYPAYAIGRWLDPLGHAHNYILNIGAEAGLVGLLGYFIFWGWVIGFTLQALTQTEAASLQRAFLAGCMGIITHLHIHNILDNLYVQGMYLHVAIILSLISLIATRKPHPAPRSIA